MKEIKKKKEVEKNIFKKSIKTASLAKINENNCTYCIRLKRCTKSFPLGISSVNVTKSVGNCEFGDIY